MYGEGKKKWDKYIGDFRNGMFHGNGTYYFSDGSRYNIYILGLYLDDLFFLNCRRYVGEFFSGLKDGKGVMYYRSGETREGTWHEDKLSGM